jgi:predicted nucleotide-binding protein (sugar kinase/HSP70/actin superfamily)
LREICNMKSSIAIKDYAGEACMPSRIVTLPYLGFYSEFVFKRLLEDLGVEVMLPPMVTEKTIKLGVRYSSALMCYPFKVTLGSLIEVLEIAKKKGVKLTYLGIGTSTACLGTCRFQQYFEIHKKICEDLGYDFDTIFIEKEGIWKLGLVFGILKAFKGINPKNSYLKIIKALIDVFFTMLREEKRLDCFDWSDTKKVRIGIVGEFYTVIEDRINYDIINRLRDMRVNVHTFIRYSNDLKSTFKGEVPKEFIKQAKNYYNGRFRAHGDASYYALYFYKHHNFDAVIHLMPLSCAPESVAEMIMDLASKRLDLPVYTFPIDEDISQTGFEMRLKSIISILEKRKKRE